MSTPLPPLESAWQTLRSSLEWAEEFGLVFIFCSDVNAKQALFRRANDLMRAKVRPFQRPEVRQVNALLKRLLPLAINPASAHLKMGMPLWLDLDGHPGDSNWNQARQEFLQRLNERRATMAREHSRTVVLALPLDWTKQAAEAAPDLWTIRQPSVYLDTQGHSLPLSEKHDTPATQAAIPQKRDLPDAVLHWQVAQRNESKMSLWDATRASEAALASGHSELAWQIAVKTVDQARTLIDGFASPVHIRNLSVSLGKLGDVARALGRLDEAQQAFRESEKLDRALMEEFGKTPERLRDLSVSISELGDVDHALGRLDEAQQAFRESEKLRRTLIDEFGKTPERLRDLSVSISKLGDVDHALGRLDEAQQAFRESEKLRRTLIDEFGKTPERLRDLSVSIGKLGDVNHALGRLDEAQHAFRESEKLHRALIDEFCKTPERLRDLCVSLERQGDVASTMGQLNVARLAFETEILIATDLIETYGETAAALEVLAYGEMYLGHTLNQQGARDQAQVHHDRARNLYRRLALALPHDARYQTALDTLESASTGALHTTDSP